MGKDALRVIDPNNDALIASVSFAEVTVQPAQYSGIPVLIVDGSGLPTLTIIPHPPPGQWRSSPKSMKPAYSAVEADWLVLAKKFGLASDLVDERGLQTFSEHVGRFTQERQTRAPTSLANTSGVGGDPRRARVHLLDSRRHPDRRLALIVAAVAWRLKWEI